MGFGTKGKNARRVVLAKPTYRTQSFKTNFTLSDDKIIAKVFKSNMARDNKLRAKNKAPIAKYDLDLKKAYLEYPDGKRVYSD